MKKVLYIAFTLVLALGLVIPLAGCGAGPGSNLLSGGRILALDVADEPAPPAQPTSSTDKADYEPGETVAFTGSGFQAGETVNIEAVGDTNGSRLTADVVADDSGAISGSLELPLVWEATYAVTATGASSGLVASTSFLDKPPVLEIYTLYRDSPSSGSSSQEIGTSAPYKAIAKNSGGSPVSGVDVDWSTTAGTLSNQDPSNKETGDDGISSIDLFCLSSGTLTATAPSNAVEWTITGVVNDKTIYVKQASLKDVQKNCPYGFASWHFVINQIADDSLAPASITVYWDGGASADVPLDKVSGRMAHYTTTANAGHIVNDATASIYNAWPEGEGPGEGQFNLSSVECEEEPPVTPQATITTDVYDADDTYIAIGGHVPLGTIVYDTATVTGNVPGTPPAGTVTFNLYKGTDDTGELIYSDTQSVGTESANSPALHAGDYVFQATYNGDSLYDPITGDYEPFVVDKGTVTLATTIYNAADDAVIPLNSNVPLATSAYDKVTVGGNTVFFNIADVTYEFNDAAAGSGVKSATKGPLHAGNHHFQAFFAGNDDYNEAQSDPEPFVVDKGTVTIVTTIYTKSGAEVTGQYPIASTTVIYDKATVTGIGVPGFEPAGTVAFTYDSTAAGSSVISGMDPVTVQSNDVGVLAAGSYAFKATYTDASGDYNNRTSDLEPFSVVKVEKGKNGKTLGFWSNKNGQTYVGAEDLLMLRLLNLVDARVADFDPLTYTPFRNWLLRADAVYMGYMLSAQLSATELTVYNGLQVGTQQVWLDDGDGIIEPGETPTINDIMNTANSLTKSTVRAQQEYYKNLLDKFNNNLLWLIFP